MFKYYISKVEGGEGSRPLLISLMQGEGMGVQNHEKCADAILERSLFLFTSNCMVFSVAEYESII